MTKSTTTHKFQVDLGGIIALLSQNLYSTPGVYVRELLQNAVDAIAARDAFDGQPAPRSIEVSPLGTTMPGSSADELSVHDQGIGIELAQVEEFLATVGASSKRDDIAAYRRNFIGQFGIGLLSCFLIADEITVVSRCASGTPAISWTGASTGTYSVSLIDDDLPVGTTVSLRPRPEMVSWARAEQVCALAGKYAEFLPAVVSVITSSGSRTVTRDFPYTDFDKHRAMIRSGSGVVLYGGLRVEQQFDAFPVTIPSTGTSGVIYITDTERATVRSHHNRIYVNNMLVSDSDRSLLPDWAFFAWCVVNSTGLKPTASREAVAEDDALDKTRQALGAAVERWLAELSSFDPLRFALFVYANEASLKEAATATPELAAILIPELQMETTQGRMKMDDIVAASPTVLYSDSTTDFRRIAAFAPNGRLVVNAGYINDVRIIEALPVVFPGTEVTYVHPATEIDSLASPPADAMAAATALETKTADVLEGIPVTVMVRVFPSANLPAIFASTEPPVHPESAKFVLNWGNRVVQALARSMDDIVFTRAMQVLLVQARMAGQYDDDSDRRMLSSALDDLLLVAVSPNRK